MLACLQSDILNLRDRDESDVNGFEVSENPPGLSGAAGKDDSLQIHSCHSPMREIEILHDNLLSMFEADPIVEIKDEIERLKEKNYQQ